MRACILRATLRLQQPPKLDPHLSSDACDSNGTHSAIRCSELSSSVVFLSRAQRWLHATRRQATLHVYSAPDGACSNPAALRPGSVKLGKRGAVTLRLSCRPTDVSMDTADTQLPESQDFSQTFSCNQVCACQLHAITMSACTHKLLYTTSCQHSTRQNESACNCSFSAPFELRAGILLIPISLIRMQLCTCNSRGMRAKAHLYLHPKFFLTVTL